MRLATCAGWPGGETPWCGAWWPRPGSNSLYGLSLVGGTKSLLWPQHQYGPMAFTTQLGFGRGCTAGMTFRNLFEDICVQCPGSQVPSKFMSKLLSVQPPCYLPLILLYSVCLTRRHVDSFRGQTNIHSSIVSPLVVFRYRVFCSKKRPNTPVWAAWLQTRHFILGHEQSGGNRPLVHIHYHPEPLQHSTLAGSDHTVKTEQCNQNG